MGSTKQALSSCLLTEPHSCLFATMNVLNCPLVCLFLDFFPCTALSQFASLVLVSHCFFLLVWRNIVTRSFISVHELAKFKLAFFLFLCPLPTLALFCAPLIRLSFFSISLYRCPILCNEDEYRSVQFTSTILNFRSNFSIYLFSATTTLPRTIPLHLNHHHWT